MKLFGLTGGIGMGKSTASELLTQRGLPVVDTDAIAHQIVEPGEPALAEIERVFGKEIIERTSGRLRRDELARIVFRNDEARCQLEAILHPRIRKIWLSRVEGWRAEGQGIGIVVIPLLFETNAAAQFDATICIACSDATQAARLRVRGWSAEQIEQRIKAQWPIEKKMLLADFVVWTEASLEVHAEQLQRIIPALSSSEARVA
jgi:dephospho-CoA kinase